MNGKPVPIRERRTEPDPSITSAIGRHHSLVSAVADLVDNSIDARARNVLVRVMLRAGVAVGLLVIDDGRGMDAAAADHAMTYARRREYTNGDLGHFGIGLKAASLSQADTLHVWSHRWGATPVGRGLERRSLDTGPLVLEFATEDAHERFSTVDAGFALDTGTIIEWHDVRAFLRSPDEAEQAEWLESQLEKLRTHLGLVLHRILAAGTVAVFLDVVDEGDLGFGGVARRVTPLDPFPPPGSQPQGLPRDLPLRVAGVDTHVQAHLWPAGSSDPGWTLGDRNPLETQGLYVYRNDRLLQAGGWNELASPSRELIHARIALDVDDALAAHITINPEKTGVVLDATLAAAFDAVDANGHRPFRDHLDQARHGAREARRHRPREVALPEPGRGFPPAVIDAFEENATFLLGHPVHVRWRILPEDQIFLVDRDARTLWLNSHHRVALGGRPGGRPDDAPVIKALTYLLLSEHVDGVYAGSRAKRVESAWNAILAAALREVRDDQTPANARPREDE